MTEVVELKSKLDELNEKQRQHSADIIRAEVDRENAKAKLTEAASMLKNLGYSNIVEANEALEELKTELERNLSEAEAVLEGDSSE